MTMCIDKTFTEEERKAHDKFWDDPCDVLIRLYDNPQDTSIIDELKRAKICWDDIEYHIFDCARCQGHVGDRKEPGTLVKLVAFFKALLKVAGNDLERHHLEKNWIAYYQSNLESFKKRNGRTRDQQKIHEMKQELEELKERMRPPKLSRAEYDRMTAAYDRAWNDFMHEARSEEAARRGESYNDD